MYLENAYASAKEKYRLILKIQIAFKKKHKWKGEHATTKKIQS